MKIFVYATLKDVATVKKAIGHKVAERPATLSGFKHVMRGEWPDIQPSSGSRVDGEIFDLDAENRKELDHWESHYWRQIVWTSEGSAQVYRLRWPKKRTENSLPSKAVYLVCGVSGSGKTWICKQLSDKFVYVPHDEHFRDIVGHIKSIAQDHAAPIITECPFAERILRDDLIEAGFEVKPIFVVELPEVIAQRYFAREKKPISKSAYTRAATIIHRADEWGCPRGTSVEMLQYLRDLVW